MRAFVIAGCIGAACPAFAADLFVVDATSGAQSARVSFNTAEEAIDILEASNLKQVINYTGVEAANLAVNFRGLPLTFAFPAQNSTQLLFTVPSLGINLAFNGSGATVQDAREDAQDQLAEYLKNGELVGQIMKELAKVSPVDPTAGNPNSMQTRMVMQDFNSALAPHASNLAPAPQQGQRVPNLIGIGIDAASYKTGEFRSSAATLPISGTFRSDTTPGRQLELRMPITLVDAEGAQSYQAGFGFTYRHPFTRHWAMAFSGNYAAAGSVDVASMATMASGSLVSSYEMPLESSTLIIGNLIGHYQTLKFKIGDFDFDPKIRNTVYRNGVMWSVPVSAWGGRFALESSYVNTIFTGTELYVESQNEFGLTFGTARDSGLIDFMRLGFTYLYSSNAKGFSVNYGYWF